ncbi:MAG: hypothetical protein COB15_09545 [Flavobacteriales bacterium]|jgi:hypothetical protein|nr:MAG: hypothetical protein COB15_09545 [Flavobacteriales bacterium]
MIGTRVVCITDQWEDRHKHPDCTFPKEGKSYTIREALRTNTGRIGYRLAEIINPGNPKCIEVAFSSKNFRSEGETFGEEISRKLELECEVESILNPEPWSQLL